MENASKALIIAGAILISILLISLGILIYNQATNITNGNQMSEVDITTFNQKFTQYEGDVTGVQVKALCQQVIANNSNSENVDRKIQVTGEVNIGSGDTTYDSSSIKNSAKFHVQLNYAPSGQANAGLVETIDVSPR